MMNIGNYDEKDIADYAMEIFYRETDPVGIFGIGNYLPVLVAEETGVSVEEAQSVLDSLVAEGRLTMGDRSYSNIYMRCKERIL